MLRLLFLVWGKTVVWLGTLSGTTQAINTTSGYSLFSAVDNEAFYTQLPGVYTSIYTPPKTVVFYLLRVGVLPIFHTTYKIKRQEILI